jgi:hypothetical protein
VTLEIQTGATSTALLLDLVLKRLLAAAPFLEQLRTASDQGEITANVEASVEAAAGQRLETRAYFALADAAAAALPGRRAYRVSPAVVARYQPLYQVLPELDGLDVISDFQRVFPSGGAPSREIVIDQVALGIWQTAIEASVVSWGRSATRNAFLDLQASRSEAPTIAIHGDVDAGSAQGPRAGSPLVKSWWQIDPQTGETLGMIAGGWGGAAPIVAIAVEVPEYLVDTMAVLTQTIGGAKAGRALAVCGGILSLWEVAKIGGAGTGVFEGELIPALPPSVQFIAIGAALILHGADIAGGQVAFMKWCVPKVAFALP